MGRLVMVRHGESEGNRDRRFTTSPGLALTERGREQALETAARIARRLRPRRVIASPYARARHTGEIIATSFGLTLDIDPTFMNGASAGSPAPRTMLLRRSSLRYWHFTMRSCL